MFQDKLNNRLTQEYSASYPCIIQLLLF